MSCKEIILFDTVGLTLSIYDHPSNSCATGSQKSETDYRKIHNVNFQLSVKSNLITVHVCSRFL